MPDAGGVQRHQRLSSGVGVGFQAGELSPSAVLSLEASKAAADRRTSCPTVRPCQAQQLHRLLLGGSRGGGAQPGCGARNRLAAPVP